LTESFIGIPFDILQEKKYDSVKAGIGLPQLKLIQNSKYVTSMGSMPLLLDNVPVSKLSKGFSSFLIVCCNFSIALKIVPN